MGRDKKRKSRRERPQIPEYAELEMGDDFDNIVQATADLCSRTGARSFECGYLHEDVPVEEAAWYCSVQFRGARLIEENHRSAHEAAFALAVRLLTGARCKCGKLVQLVEGGAVAYTKSTLVHGFGQWDAEHSRTAGQCRWRRTGARWLPSCDAPPLTMPSGAR